MHSGEKMTSSPLSELTLEDITAVPLPPLPESIRDSLEIERISDSWIEVLDAYGDLESQPPSDSTFWKDLEADTEEKYEEVEVEVEVEDDKPIIITSTSVMNFCKFCGKFCGEERVCAFHRCLINNCDEKRSSKGMCNKHYLQASKRCLHEGCRNMIQTKGLCLKHAGKEKVKKCSENDCTKFAHKGGKCYTHGEPQKRCSEEGCESIAKKGGVCIRHGADFPKCIHPGCNYGRRKDGLCEAHHPTARKCINCQFYQVRIKGEMCSICAGYRENSEEFKLRDLINIWFQDMNIIHDKIIEGSCLRYRPDFFIEAPKGHIIIVEVDEYNHKDYDINCEVVRMFNIQQAIMTPIVFVRYNPDTYKPDGNKTKALKRKHRYNKLRATIARLIHFPPEFLPGIPEIEYLYYPQPRIELLNEEYKQKINVLM